MREYADVAGAGHMVAGDRNDVFTDAVVDFLEAPRLTALQPSMHAAAVPMPIPTPTALARMSLNSTARDDE